MRISLHHQRNRKMRRFRVVLIHLKGIETGFGKEGLSAHRSPLILEIPAHTELKKEARCHANQYIATASDCSNRGNLDSPCPETIELYRCHLSHYIWHSRVGPLIGTRFFSG